MTTKEELRAAYPIGREFTNGSGHKCRVVGYRNNKYRGVQLLVKVLWVWPDGFSETIQQAIDAIHLPEFTKPGGAS